VPRTAPPEAACAEAAGQAAAAMERFLAANPTQWFPFSH
jgi:hypothetical protein